MRKLKKIVILFPSFGTGGVTNNLINFVNFCTDKKINIYLISDINNQDKKLFKKKYIRFINIKNNFIFSQSNRIVTSISSIAKLIKLCFHLDSKDTIIFSFQSHILPIIFCKIFSKKIIIRNSEDIFEATKFADNKLFAYFILFLKFLFYRFSDGIITNSSRSKNSLIKLVNNHIRLIFNPYLKKIYQYKKKRRKNILLSVGRLCKQKNQSIIIDAFQIFLKKFPKYKLLIIGHGTDYKKLKNLTSNLNLSNNVKFLGRKTKLKKFYINSKIFVFPSLYEGLPNALIDSLNYNLPAISTDCSGARDILGKNYKDYVIHNNSKILAKKMINMINNYDQKVNSTLKMRHNLHSFLIKNQSLKYLNYCEEVLHSN